MMKERRYSNDIKSISLQTSLYDTYNDSVSQTATPSRMARNSTTV